ncbi:MAG TPA: creatininase family protein [Saprospiraceae bacterium]|nr:creatininase family protein [Saprospiraceae bacterium]HMQ83417.1 creatininase family protein [Saprospiraceae bacterium]
MSSKPYLLAESTWKTVKDSDYQVALLPWGATEAHNFHLPYATDCYEAEYVAAEAARQAWEMGAKTIVLPCIPFGVNTGQLDVKLCMNMLPSTQYAILKDVADVLLRHHIQKLVIINSHGGNNFKNMIREMSIDFPEVFMCSVDWWRIGEARQYFDEPGDHAGELETSVIMYIQPELVRPLEEAGPGIGRNFKVKALREGWVTTQRQWTKVTDDTGVGNPSKSSAEKGRHFLEMTTREIAIFLSELAATDLEDLYEN